MENDNVISTYTDAQAIEDGVLVAVSKRDRVTGPLFSYLCEWAPLNFKPPSDWPVDMMLWFKAKTAQHKAAAMALGLFAVYGHDARRIYEENIGGGIWKFYAGGRPIVAFEETEIAQGREIWMLPNEIGGLTLMFPEDY